MRAIANQSEKVKQEETKGTARKTARQKQVEAQWDVDVLEQTLRDARGVVSILDIGIDRVCGALGLES